MNDTTRRLALALLAVGIALPASDSVMAAKSEAKKATKANASNSSVTHRQTLVIHEGFPIRRSWPTVVVRASRQNANYIRPSTYAAPVRFSPVTGYPRDVTWRDSERLWSQDGWVESRLSVNATGRRLFLVIDGKVQFSFAEIIFENGSAQAIDFHDQRVRSGRYLLADFEGLAAVDHVRVVSRARSGEARVSLLLDQ